MTGHDLDLEACKRIPHPVAKVLVAEVESLRAKLAAAEQERDAYKRAKAENDERFMLRYMRAEAALEAVRGLADIHRSDHITNAAAVIRDLDAVLAAAEQDEPKRCSTCGESMDTPGCCKRPGDDRPRTEAGFHTVDGGCHAAEPKREQS